jgi:hypothetical protein
MSDSSKNKYDFVVIGSGASSLLMSSFLSQHSSKVLWLDSATKSQQSDFSVESFVKSHHIDFIPYSDGMISTLSSLFKGFQLNLPEISFNESQIKHYQNNQWLDFVGFGESPPVYQSEISYFLAKQSLGSNESFDELVRQAFERSQAERINPAVVTKIQIENETATSVIINGQKAIEAEQFVFMTTPQDFIKCLPESFMSQRSTNKIIKQKYLASINMEFKFETNIFENCNLRLITISESEGNYAIVGYPIELKTQESLWTFFIQQDITEDPEQLAAEVKKMKKAILKSLGFTEKDILKEKLVIKENAERLNDLRTDGMIQIEKLQNVYLGSGLLNSAKNLNGMLNQFEILIDKLGMHPEGHRV